MLNNLGLGILLTAKDMASGVMDKVRGEFEMLGQGSRLAGADFKAAQAMFKEGLADFGKGAIIAGVGAAGLRTVWGLADAAGKADAKIAEISTLIDESVFPTEKLRGVTEELALEYGKMPTEEAAALYQTISAGVTDAAKATDLLRVANELAIGGVTDARTAVDSLTTVVNAYAATGAEARDVSDAMFVAIRAGKTDAAQLAGSLGLVIPIASALNVSYTELLASVAAMTTQGMSTSMAMTGLKAAFSNIQKPTADAQKEAKRLKIEFTAASLRTKGWAGFLDMVTSSANYNADSLAKLFGSVEAVGAVQNLVSNDSAKFNEVLGQMGDRAGGTAEAFDKMSNTLPFQQAKFAAQWQVLKEQIGRVFLPFVLNVMSKVSTAVSWLGEKFAAIPAPVREFLGTLIPVALTLTTAAGAIKMVIGLTKMWRAATIALGIAQKASSGGAALALGVVGVALTLLITHWEEVKAMAEMVGVAVVNAWSHVEAFFRDLWDRFQRGSQRVHDFAVGVWEKGAAAVRTAWDAVAFFFTDTLPLAALKGALALRELAQQVPLLGSLTRILEDVSGVVTGVSAADLDSMTRALEGAGSIQEFQENRGRYGPGGNVRGFSQVGQSIASGRRFGESLASAAAEAQATGGAPVTSGPPSRPPGSARQQVEQVTHVSVKLDGREIAEAVERRIQERMALGYGVPEEA